ncbi:MAG: hypothetical protein A2W85_13455 [Bacteroidetes bacterium GWF2_41_31]|nr:MAG: hypothetical protein A2W85_13455 [Bacteroidetes bacterium GWF2_41_31]OFZ02317.1 MAG: hypothetical protein A2338_02710 [Bacteroidetes bacterium RIFOXYB12_FULL_41_6]
MESLYQYLHRIGLLEQETSPEELAQAKREYRKTYQRAYQKIYRDANIRKDIYFTPTEHKQLSKIAQKYHLSVPGLCKQLTFAYLKTQFVLPDDQQVRGLELYLRGVTNNHNQLIRYIHQKKDLKISDIENLNERVNAMETKVSQALRSPINLQEYLENEIQQKPETLSLLQYLLETHSKQ